MFLKNKQRGRIKGRGCADGRKQCDCCGKEDASSPTVSIKAFMLSYMMDVMEGRDTAKSDMLGEFLHADMNERWLIFCARLTQTNA